MRNDNKLKSYFFLNFIGEIEFADESKKKLLKNCHGL